MTSKFYQEHRFNLADAIIAKSYAIKQEQPNEVIYFFVRQPLGRALAMTALLLAFVAGFIGASDQSSSQQASMVEEIYYPESKIL